MAKKYHPKTRKRKKAHGFLVRKRSAGGRKIVQRRKRKGRKKVSA